MTENHSIALYLIAQILMFVQQEKFLKKGTSKSI